MKMDAWMIDASPPSPLTMECAHVFAHRGVARSCFHLVFYKRVRGVVLLVQEFVLVKF